MKDRIKQKEREEPLKVSANVEMLKGAYCNSAFIKHSKDDFILDFIMAESGEGYLVSKVITNPSHAKKILKALKDNVEKYEKSYGEIKTD
ncbi:MAG: DUF3467 domain-containing protein [Opitutae bacterium]|jgi:hypothetical protein|nr:DUF3467 domain-containing protein [Opitutae bacterium]MDG2345349.1 DUF3467 domain-containing protein [Opitutae bacterium]